MKKIGIIGAGASGLIAALEASDGKAEVTLFERKEKIGQKLLVTGNGRCNFTNLNLSSGFYYTDNPDFIDNVYEIFGNKELISYMMSLGLLVKDKNGYCYPASEQAAGVLDVFRAAIDEKRISVCCDSNVISVKNDYEGFSVSLENGKKYHFDKVILASGGKSGLKKNDYANGYDMAKELGHTVTRLYPALTQVKCLGINFKAISGVRSDASIEVFDGNQSIMTQSGEVLFTDYGMSGIVTFQISHLIAELLDNGKKVCCRLDFLPGMTLDELQSFFDSKCLIHPEYTVEEMFSGFINKKLCFEIVKMNGLDLSKDAVSYPKEKLSEVLFTMKNTIVSCQGVNGFEHSQVTGGGIPLSEVDSNFQSRIHKGLFITGELLNVDGLCGGYNLQWAFSSGAIAGRNAASD